MPMAISQGNTIRSISTAPSLGLVSFSQRKIALMDGAGGGSSGGGASVFAGDILLSLAAAGTGALAFLGLASHQSQASNVTTVAPVTPSATGPLISTPMASAAQPHR